MLSIRDTAQDLRPASTNTFVWAIVPIIFILFVILASLVIYYRRRRRSSQGYEMQQPLSQNRTTTRRRTGPRTAPDEGLNELGEAPPPYAGKTGSIYSDSGDLEAGRSPPEYPAVPPPAVTAAPRTSV